MRWVFVLNFICSSCLFFSQQNVLITDNTATIPDQSSLLELNSTSKGLLIPRVPLSSVTDGTTITLPSSSLLVYNTNGSILNGAGEGYYYNSGTSLSPNWIKILASNSIGEWKLLGNSGTDASSNFLGTTDNVDLVFRTNSLERIRTLGSNGNVGIGTSTPSAKLHLAGNGTALSGNGIIVGSINTALNTNVAIGAETGRFEIAFPGYRDVEPNQIGSKIASIRRNNYQANSALIQSSDLAFFTGSGSTGGSTTNFQDITSESMRIVGTTGNVGIGTTSPVDKLDVRDAMSVNEIKFRNVGGVDDSDPYRLRKTQNTTNNNELQLHLNDDSDERFAIYGNSCSANSCGEYSTSLYHFFRADGTAYHQGRVGIGTTTPNYPLDVSSTVTTSISNYRYQNGNQCGNNSNSSGSNPFSIRATGRILCTELNTTSDSRIKSNIIALDTKSQLDNLKKLRIVEFSYIDKLEKGDKLKTGLIAQEVEQINSNYVNLSNDFIPNIYSTAIHTNLKEGSLKVTTENPHGLKKGDEVRFFAEGVKQINKEIFEIVDEHSFIISNWNESITDLFVYGKKVQDLRSVDFDQITAMSVAAIQELSKQLTSSLLEIKELKAMLENLKLENSIKEYEFNNIKNELEWIKSSLPKAVKD